MQGNWVDLIILAVLVFFALEAFRVGVWIILADLSSFIISLIVSLRFYPLVSKFLQANFSLNLSIANALGFLVLAIIIESFLGLVLSRVLRKIPAKIWEWKLSKLAGVVPAIAEGLVLIAFVLMLVLALPISPKVKNDISASTIGQAIVEKTAGVEGKLNDIFGGVIEQSLTYFTIKPQSQETVNLQITSFDLSVDSASETEMFKLVNQERQAAGVGQLVWEENLVPVARAHAEDMWRRQYFSHISPDGADVGDRLQSANINYSLAGENLALAPTVATAHTGLMNSPGHRENILEGKFRKMGIGVIDNGYYGKMFVQVFSD